MKATRLLFALAVLGAGACDFNITDPNNPGPIGPNPSRSEVGASVIGIIQASRNDAANWNLTTGILGREAYRFDGSEPRYISELLQSPWDPGGFGAGHWLAHYQAIRSAAQLLDVIDGATALSTEERKATRGFAETMKAHQFLGILMGHGQDSIPWDVDRPYSAPPAPFLANNAVWDSVAALLDVADGDLAAGGSAFPFSLPSGFSGFDDPTSFRMVNRALKAAVDVYRGSLYCGAACYTSAKTLLENGSTFIDTSAAAAMNAGVYFNYSTNPGDVSNPLFQNSQTGENNVHPSVRDSVQVKLPADTDARYLAKTTGRPQATAGTPVRATDVGWIRYPSTDAPIPIIRNEELILLRAEANNAVTANPVAAANDVNYVRVKSGGIDPIPTLSTLTQAEILRQILVEGEYSLLYEGHRWFDMRRTGRINQLVKDFPADVIHDIYPVPEDEVNARK